MTYREYFAEHTAENFSWCKPYADRTEDNFVIMHDGSVDGIVVASENPYYGSHTYRYDSFEFEDQLEALARKLAPDYDDRDESDLQIVLGAMHEIGCAHCPFRHECEAMDEEMDQSDYR